MSNDEVMLSMVKEIGELKAEVKRLASLKPLYTILNPAEPENITADQNNYALGDYDILFLNPTASRIIHGITNGYKGRMLYIVNVASQASGFNLTFNHQSASASALNRISVLNSVSLVLAGRRTALFQYTSSTAITSAGAGRWLHLLNL